MSNIDNREIIIDDREKNLISLIENKEYLELYPELNINLKVVVKRLDLADIVISEKTAIERKGGFDFPSSITDNRLFEQLERLKNNYENAILIVEGLNDDVLNNTNIRIQSIYGALVSIAIKKGIKIIPTRNLIDTVIVIDRLSYKEHTKDNVSFLARKAPKGMTKQERRAHILEGLIDCGPKKAKILIKIFTLPENVFKALKLTNVIYTKSGNFKDLEGPFQAISGFGPKFVLSNKELLFGEKANSLNGYSKTKQKKIR